MSEFEPSLHHYQIQLTIDLWSSDPQSIRHDEAILRLRLIEALKFDPTSTKNALGYTFEEILPDASSCTNHTNDQDVCLGCGEYYCDCT